MIEKLVLTVEMKTIGTGGMLEGAEILSEEGMSIKEAMLWDWTETMARAKVHVVFCGVPSEKFLNDDFDVYVKEGEVIGVAVVLEELTPLRPRRENDVDGTD